jgi:hypothetical protein
MLPPTKSEIFVDLETAWTGINLRDKCHQLAIMLGLFIWIKFKNLANTVVVIPLLQKLLFVCHWVPLDQVL